MKPRGYVLFSMLAAALELGSAPSRACPTPRDALAPWAEAYLRWYLGERELPLDEHGNAVLGHTVLLPIPPTPGDGTPGSAAVTLDEHQSFTLPLWGLVGSSHDDGTPPDPFAPVSIFRTLDITVRLDGVPLITRDNVLDFFTRLTLEPPIAVDEPPGTAIVWYETVGILEPPLPPGAHTLELHAVNTEPAFGTFFEYQNTWELTVVE
jgi:hypothetical protein